MAARIFFTQAVMLSIVSVARYVKTKPAVLRVCLSQIVFCLVNQLKAFPTRQILEIAHYFQKIFQLLGNLGACPGTRGTDQYHYGVVQILWYRFSTTIEWY